MHGQSHVLFVSRQTQQKARTERVIDTKTHAQSTHANKTHSLHLRLEILGKHGAQNKNINFKNSTSPRLYINFQHPDFIHQKHITHEVRH